MLKKSAEQNSLLAMEEFKLRQLWPCLTATQQRWYHENKPAFDARQIKLAAMKVTPSLPLVKK